eukprot:jgi/Undpi1/7785/HiC_scaffold_23.g10258.m1
MSGTINIDASKAVVPDDFNTIEEAVVVTDGQDTGRWMLQKLGIWLDGSIRAASLLSASNLQTTLGILVTAGDADNPQDFFQITAAAFGGGSPGEIEERAKRDMCAQVAEYLWRCSGRGKMKVAEGYLIFPSISFSASGVAGVAASAEGYRERDDDVQSVASASSAGSAVSKRTQGDMQSLISELDGMMERTGGEGSSSNLGVSAGSVTKKTKPTYVTHKDKWNAKYANLLQATSLDRLKCLLEPQQYGHMTYIKHLIKRNTLLAWVKGVNVLDFIDPDTSGIYQGHSYSGAELTPVHLRNHVPDEFTSWVTDEVQALVRKGCVAQWADIADVSVYEKPHMVLPLGVEPKKPRLIWDARWLNLMCRHLPFTMDGVGKVAQCVWKGAYQVTIDHKAGYHHVALSTESWQYLGFEWKGEFYVFTVLAFGWCSAPVIYASLSEAVARYLRSRDIPTLTWIDDFYVVNFGSTRLLEAAKQCEAALVATYVALEVFFSAGYFISLPKCEIDPTTRLVFLGIICDTVACRFEAPQDKLEKLEVILTETVTSGAITFRTLEKLAGKCTSLSVAVPVAALYTHHMYRQIAKFQRTGGRKKSMEIDIPKNSGLMFELTKWLEVRQRFNGAS